MSGSEKAAGIASGSEKAAVIVSGSEKEAVIASEAWQSPEAGSGLEEIAASLRSSQ